MSYVHGLGDAQERFAKEDEYRYGWISDLKIICPHCGLSHQVEIEGYEQTDSDEWGDEWTISCWCEACSKEFKHIHENDYS
jgi:DNA-directed RNA polymerase subunit RPC12/RpoP